MKNDTKREDSLNFIISELTKERRYMHAAAIIDFDQMTVCPKDGQEAQGEASICVSNHAFRIRKNPEFIKNVEYLYEHVDEFDEAKQVLIRELHKSYIRSKDITPEMHEKFAQTFNQAWVAWSHAREIEDSTDYLPKLEKVIETNVTMSKIFGRLPGEEGFSDYEMLLGRFEPGITTEKLDDLFGKTGKAIKKLLKGIENSPKVIRTDFLDRPVKNTQQEEISKYIMNLMGFNFDKGRMALSEHPFTSRISKDDIRITTHYYPNMFLSSIYSVIHECGHALFEQLVLEEDYDNFIEDEKSLGMHESVSRFYENVIGRSREFIELIYPKVCEVFPQAMRDVTVDDLYEAVNFVQPSLIRTEADELTYTMHIIIRYELEKQLIGGQLSIKELPGAWRCLYKKCLGIEPKKCSEGLLQDVHWTSDFGYFPTYALGNFYNAMFLSKMREEFDPFECVANGDFAKINNWLKKNVFSKANRLNPQEWIEAITGKKLSAEPFIEYLTEKYHKIYDISGTSELDLITNNYIKRIKRIRKLSSPVLDDLDNSSEYSKLLRENFKQIGKIATVNRDAIKNLVQPMLNRKKAFSPEMIENAWRFCDQLTNPGTGVALDPSLAFAISSTVLKDAENSGDVNYLILSLYNVICNSYLMVNQTKRLVAAPEVADSYRSSGLTCVKKILEFLEPEKFLSINIESRKKVMVMARYGAVLYEYVDTDICDVSEYTRRRIDMLYEALKLAKDPFYIDAIPDYNWPRYILKVYEYILLTAPFDDPYVLDSMVRASKELENYGRLYPEEYMKVFSLENIFSTVEEIKYVAGLCKRDDHMKHMYSIWKAADSYKYDISGGDMLIAASSYITAARDGNITEEMRNVICDMYNSIAAYAFRIPMLEYISSVLGIYSGIMLRYVELPGSMTFKEFGLKMMVAFHPPTYIHSNMVAKLSVCLADHLMANNPELFVGICGCPNVKKVKEYRNKIYDFAFNCGLCHDFGKLMIIDTVFIYGRELLPIDMSVIRAHSIMGAELLKRNDSTRDYADVAAAHHMWYDESRGYPEGYELTNPNCRTIIDIVCLADCMDAATDSIGRSYNKGKTLNAFIKEVQSTSGTRYSPYLADLLTKEDVRKDLEFLLKDERENVYRDTYKLCRRLQEEDPKA